MRPAVRRETGDGVGDEQRREGEWGCELKWRLLDYGVVSINQARIFVWQVAGGRHPSHLPCILRISHALSPIQRCIFKLSLSYCTLFSAPTPNHLTGPMSLLPYCADQLNSETPETLKQTPTRPPAAPVLSCSVCLKEPLVPLLVRQSHDAPITVAQSCRITGALRLHRPNSRRWSLLAEGLHPSFLDLIT